MFSAWVDETNVQPFENDVRDSRTSYPNLRWGPGLGGRDMTLVGRMGDRDAWSSTSSNGEAGELVSTSLAHWAQVHQGASDEPRGETGVESMEVRPNALLVVDSTQGPNRPPVLVHGLEPAIGFCSAPTSNANAASDCGRFPNEPTDVTGTSGILSRALAVGAGLGRGTRCAAVTTNELCGELVVLSLLLTVRPLEAADVVRVRALSACTLRPGERVGRFKLRRVLREGVGMYGAQGPRELLLVVDVLGVAGLPS